MVLIIPIWKRAPFVRLLLPQMIGIILQFFLHFSVQLLVAIMISSVVMLIVMQFIPLFQKFKFDTISGVAINLLTIAASCTVTFFADQTKEHGWYGKQCSSGDVIIATVAEKPVAKQNTYKAELNVNAIYQNDSIKHCSGKIIAYIQRDTSLTTMNYGDQILFSKPLQEIKNSGNPGCFDYRQYCGFHGMYHQVYLKQNDLHKIGTTEINSFNSFLINARSEIVNALRANINGREESGIAEALLIGYKEDLDKDLVKAYSNTGVVHIIAISGLHLGLIYMMLLWICSGIPVVKNSRLLKLIIILSSLWLFSLLTGASASVLRSAVMFTCILTGQSFGKKSSIYNPLAASAFLLLCYDPYLLWDAGFQLSYLALVGIVIFQKPIKNLMYVNNKWIRKIWELIAVSLAAQVLTFPVCIFYFHQFPNVFLITNLITVPFSSIILFAEIFMLLFSWIPVVASFTGKVISSMIWLMNKFVQIMMDLPYSSWKNIYFSLNDTVIVYLIVIFLSIFFMRKWKPGLMLSLCCLLVILLSGIQRDYLVAQQQKIIVYNIPKHRAIDFIKKDEYNFIGDSLVTSGALEDMHILPARLSFGSLTRSDHFEKNVQFVFPAGRSVLLLDTAISFEVPAEKIPLDLVIVSKNIKINMADVANVFDVKLFVFDASNSPWKTVKWKEECDELGLKYYMVAESGAYVEDL